MYQITAKVEGMACGMCEAHISDAIRKAFPNAKKVSASKSKKQASFLSEEAMDEALLRETIEKTGYHFISADCTEYVKKGLFGFGRK